MYAPNSHQIHFFRALFKCIASVKYGHLLICGDFNLPTDPHLDTSSRVKGRGTLLRQLFHTKEVYDVWRCQHAIERDYTYFSSRHRTYTRVDMFVSDKIILKNTWHYMVWPCCNLHNYWGEACLPPLFLSGPATFGPYKNLKALRKPPDIPKFCTYLDLYPFPYRISTLKPCSVSSETFFGRAKKQVANISTWLNIDQ